MTKQVDPGLVQAELRGRRDRARSAFDRAIWCLVLGQPDDGRAAIGREVRAGPEDGAVGFAGLMLALAVGERVRAASAARHLLGEVAQYVVGFRDYLGAMLALIAGDDETARAHLAELERCVAAHDKLRSGHPSAVKAIPQGLLEGNAPTVAAGVESLLAWHLRRARTRSNLFNSSLAMVCLDAVAALVLAHERGLAIDVAPTYRSARLPLLATHMQEWNGQPLPSGVRLDVRVDLVAGAWLRRLGVPVTEPAAGETSPARRPRAPQRKTDADEEVVVESLRLRLRGGQGSPWQLASWALMLGEVHKPRDHLRAGAAAARQRWHGQSPPNPSSVREHFGLALVLADDAGLAETTPTLQAWMQSVEPAQSRYAHAHGALDLVCDLLGSRASAPTRDAVTAIRGPLSATRVACAGLVDRDPTVLTQGLDAMLVEHARMLERRSSPPPPVCEWAVYLAAAARSLGQPVIVDDRHARHAVPIEIRNVADHTGEVGRLPCDLLGHGLWSDGGYNTSRG